MSAYKNAGVDIEKADEFVHNIKLLDRVQNKGTLKSHSGYGCLYQVPKTYENPVIVTSTDGVGTKLLLALEQDDAGEAIFNIGIDLVAMCVNDLLCENATPVQFLDYYATNSIGDNSLSLLKGIVRGCNIAECELVGGETAEMPGLYCENEFDVAGFAMGLADGNSLFNPEDIKQDDVVFGLPSSGFHSNGFSLIRQILSTNAHSQHLVDLMLEPTRIYVNDFLALSKWKTPLKGIAHITGGGWYRNIARILPKDKKVVLESTYNNDIFDWVQQAGNISTYEMYNTFNCGIGLMFIVDNQYIDVIKNLLPYSIQLGTVQQKNENNEAVEIWHGTTKNIKKTNYSLVIR